jgi:hypothetical protein
MQLKNNWPEKEGEWIGRKVTFKGVPSIYYPMFTDVGQKARELFVVGQEYTITKCSIYSSWIAIELEGVEGKYHLQFFNYER